MALSNFIPERHFWVVCTAAAIGGVAGAVYPSKSAGGSIDYSDPWIFLSIPFGIAAAAIFVYLISNTARDDLYRVGALAFVAAFAWEPVIKGAQKQFVENTDEAIARQISDYSTAIEQASSNTSDPKSIAMIEEAIAKINSASSQLRDPSVIYRIDPNIAARIANSYETLVADNPTNESVFTNGLSSNSLNAILGNRVQFSTANGPTIAIVPPANNQDIHGAGIDVATGASPTAVLDWNSQAIRDALGSTSLYDF